MSERLCVFCRHLEMNTRGCYGDYPDPATFECMKGHWTEEMYSDLGEFRTQILRADKCADYKEAK